jgi:hypothetical protein
MVNRKIRAAAFAVATLAAGSAGIASASPVNAHASSYCGHGSDGLRLFTHFVSHHTHSNGVHHHIYSHTNILNQKIHENTHVTC